MVRFQLSHDILLTNVLVRDSSIEAWMHEVVAEIPFFPSMSMQFVTNFIVGVSFVSKMNTCFRFKYHVSWLGSNVTFSKVMIQSIFLLPLQFHQK
jgi:hypothetical protein